MQYAYCKQKDVRVVSSMGAGGRLDPSQVRVTTPTAVVGVRGQHNPSGGPGLATAGTGDVLSGLIGALAAQGLMPFEAARLGAWLHGVAGELACEALTAPGMTAGDVLDALPMAWKALAE